MLRSATSLFPSLVSSSLQTASRRCMAMAAPFQGHASPSSSGDPMHRSKALGDMLKKMTTEPMFAAGVAVTLMAIMVVNARKPEAKTKTAFDASPDQERMEFIVVGA